MEKGPKIEKRALTTEEEAERQQLIAEIKLNDAEIAGHLLSLSSDYMDISGKKKKMKRMEKPN